MHDILFCFLFLLNNRGKFYVKCVHKDEFMHQKGIELNYSKMHGEKITFDRTQNSLWDNSKHAQHLCDRVFCA